MYVLEIFIWPLFLRIFIWILELFHIRKHKLPNFKDKKLVTQLCHLTNRTVRQKKIIFYYSKFLITNLVMGLRGPTCHILECLISCYVFKVKCISHKLSLRYMVLWLQFLIDYLLYFKISSYYGLQVSNETAVLAEEYIKTELDYLTFNYEIY